MHDHHDPDSGESLDPDNGSWYYLEQPGAATDTIWDRPLGQAEPHWPHGFTFEAERFRKMRYADYLKTWHWHQILRWILWRARGKCERCLAAHVVLHVHHRTYDRLGQELPEDLEALCRPCHELEHGITEP